MMPRRRSHAQSDSNCAINASWVFCGRPRVCLKSRSLRVTLTSRRSAAVAHRPSVEPLRSYFSWMATWSGSRLFITTIRCCGRRRS